MTYVALLLAASLGTTVVVGSQLLRAMQRQHARERDILTNQLLHAVGKPWQPAPADERTTEPDIPWEPKPKRFVANVERMPTSYAE